FFVISITFIWLIAVIDKRKKQIRLGDSLSVGELYKTPSQYVVPHNCAMLVPLEFGKSAAESVVDAADPDGVEIQMPAVENNVPHRIFRPPKFDGSIRPDSSTVGISGFEKHPSKAL